MLGPEAGAASGIVLHDFYVPAGGDVPDRDLNPKFAHKLDFLTELRAWGGKRVSGPAILMGDLNVAPLEHDVWSHKQLLDVVSHTPVETEALEILRGEAGWIDTARHLTPEPEKIYTWWSYRSPDWAGANKGRRLDHLWVSPGSRRHGPQGRGAARGPGLGAPIRPRAGDLDAGTLILRPARNRDVSGALPAHEPVMRAAPMRKILIAFLLPKVVSYLRRRYGKPHGKRNRAF